MAHNFPVLSYEEAHKWETQALERCVSTVARSSRGFMRAYQSAGSWANLDPWWKNRRQAFLARHMAQAVYRRESLWEVVRGKTRPTRRGLAMIMWAYMPPKNIRVNPGPSVGHTWQSPIGKRTVMQIGDRNGVLSVAIATENSPFAEIIPYSQLERQILIDESSFKSRSAAKLEEKTAPLTHEERVLEDYITASELPPAMAGKLRSAAHKSVVHKGNLTTRLKLAIKLLKEDWRPNHNSLGPIVENNDGIFLIAKDIGGALMHDFFTWAYHAKKT